MSEDMPGTKEPMDLELARKVLRMESEAIRRLIDRIDGNFDFALQVIHKCQGRIVVTGMGKSGIICRKIAATLSSTGTPAFFLHPAEATHGDLGVIQSNDVIIALSHSGETEELLKLLVNIRRLGAKLVVMTGSKKSTLGKAADVVIDYQVDEETYPLNLAPTASTTAALALGDALAITLLVKKGFREEDFANLHPDGTLGKKFSRVERLMHKGDHVPKVDTNTLMRDVIYEITSKALGMTCVVDVEGKLVGIITDGDLRRYMSKSHEILNSKVSEVMTAAPVTIRGSILAIEAIRIMETQKITSIIVVNENNFVDGVIHVHDLWKTEMR
jgi:arabinose-5-phosphate isomerase